ncbi:hypothetical protein GCG54_00002622 [Colletotrichum gloeosporioides]|uniref:Uncharacterized protein n=1 Tax=Colletotrichum gloeosporioides TaxID=474922 RepID=A0A8H4FPZ3_COLGL|nr:uncharacterized protein GCG54_00002622 [Colletotrichum gloeosporioides]KAF3810170.1 hypothetical protein GCG54_00002622 [Colletotrichum gloeosporioides]
MGTIGIIITVRVFDKYRRRTGVPAASYLVLPQAHRPPLNIDHHASLFVVNQEDQVTSTASMPSSPRMAVRRGLQLAFQVYQDNDDAVDICVSPAATVQPQPPVDSVPEQRHLLASVSLAPH